MTTGSDHGSGDRAEGGGSVSKITRTAEPSSRDGRLADIRTQVQNDTYKIDALELSKSIIQKHIIQKHITR